MRQYKKSKNQSRHFKNSSVFSDKDKSNKNKNGGKKKNREMKRLLKPSRNKTSFYHRKQAY